MTATGDGDDNDTCGNTETIGPVNVVSGVATFSGIGDRFYTITSDSISAQLDKQWGVILNPPPQLADTPNANVHVVVNPDLISPTASTTAGSKRSA